MEVVIVKMKNIREIAEKMHLKPGTMNKQDLIRSIQEKEGNTPCFKMEQPFCGQYDCCWRSDCKPGDMKEMLETC